MAFNFRKFLNGLNLVPKSISTASSQGDLEVLSSTGKLVYHNGTSASPAVTEAHSATLTNKTINAASNTISGVLLSSGGTLTGNVLFPAGSSALPSVALGNTTTGFSKSSNTQGSVLVYSLDGIDVSNINWTTYNNRIAFVVGNNSLFGELYLSGTLLALNASDTSTAQNNAILCGNNNADTLVITGDSQDNGLYGASIKLNARSAASNPNRTTFYNQGLTAGHIDGFGGSYTGWTIGNTASDAHVINGTVTLNQLTASSFVVTNASKQLTTVSEPLAVSLGGTNFASYTTGDILYASSSSVLSKLPIGSTGQVLKVIAALPVWGSAASSLAVISKTANYSILSTDDVILADASGGTFILTLPDAITNAGKTYNLKKTDSTFNIVTINTTSSQTIDGSTSSSLNTQNENLVVVSDGTNWRILDRKNQMPWTSYTLTIGATTTAPTKGTIVADFAYWRRVGDSIEIKYDLFTNTAGTNGSGTYLFPLPSGLTMDSTKTLTSSSNQLGVVGFGGAFDSVTSRAVQVLIYDSTNVSLKTIGPNAPGSPDPTDINSSAFSLGNSSLKYTFYYKVPITGWKA